jgi:hypothetical protein
VAERVRHEERVDPGRVELIDRPALQQAEPQQPAEDGLARLATGR